MELTINELMDEIDSLNEQIENEPVNSIKRKYQIDFEIDELKKERDHAGFHYDSLSVQKCNLRIEQLEKEKTVGSVPKFKSEIEIRQKQIVNIIMEYYKDGIFIEDIIKLESIPPSISENWFDLSNFGNDSGYLFVDAIDEDEYKWIYSNPITEIQFKSKTLEDLMKDIGSANEILLIFDKKLAEKSNKRDLAMYHDAIDLRLTDLESYEISNASDDFNYMKEHAEKFDGYQIRRLCQIMIDNPKLDNSDDFNYIVDINKDKFDEIDYEGIYSQIIDNKLNRLSGLSYEHKAVSDLKHYSDKFNKNQLITLCNLLVDREHISSYFDDFIYILNVNENQIEDIKFYKRFIDMHIEKLNDDDLSDWDKNILFEDLNLCADKFSESQVFQLCDLVHAKFHFSNHYIKNILDSNVDTVDSDFYGKFYEKIINKCLDELDAGDLDSDEVERNFIDLRVCSDYFTQDQIFRLCDLIFDKEYILNNFEDLIYILDANENRLNHVKFDEIYNKLIENGMAIFEDSNLECNAVSKLFRYLKSFSIKISSDQLNRLCNIVIRNPELCCFADYFKDILCERIDEIDKDFSEISSEIIDGRIKFLKDFDSNNIDSGYIIGDLRQFENNFTNEQLDDLSDTVIHNTDIVNFAHDFNHILEVNEDTFDRDYDEIYCRIINNRIEKMRIEISTLNLCKIFNDLNVYSQKINENQMKSICEIVNEKKLNCNNNDVLNFFSANEDKFDDSVNDNICQIIIDVKIDKLDKISFGYSDANNILISLKDYVDKFTKVQITNLCHVANSNSQVYNSYKCRPNLEYILDKTKDMIDDELYEETIIRNNIKKK